MWLKTPSCIPICGEAYWNQRLSLIFFSFELKFVCHPFVSDHALRKQVLVSSEIFIFFRALKEEENRYLSRSFRSLIYTSLWAITFTICHDGRHFLLLIYNIGGFGYIIRAAHCLQPRPGAEAVHTEKLSA